MLVICLGIKNFRSAQKPLTNSMNFLIQSQNIMKIILWKFLIGRCAKVYAPKRVEFEWTFDLLLINFTVVRVYFSVFLTMPRKYFMWMNINFMGNRSWNKANIFTCFWYWCWKNRFFNVKLNLFMNYFYKCCICKCSSK